MFGTHNTLFFSQPKQYNFAIYSFYLKMWALHFQPFSFHFLADNITCVVRVFL